MTTADLPVAAEDVEQTQPRLQTPVATADIPMATVSTDPSSYAVDNALESERNSSSRPPETGATNPIQDSQVDSGRDNSRRDSNHHGKSRRGNNSRGNSRRRKRRRRKNRRRNNNGDTVDNTVGAINSSHDGNVETMPEATVTGAPVNESSVGEAGQSRNNAVEGSMQNGVTHIVADGQVDNTRSDAVDSTPNDVHDGDAVQAGTTGAVVSDGGRQRDEAMSTRGEPHADVEMNLTGPGNVGRYKHIC